MDDESMFRYIRRDALPRLAWCARLASDSVEVAVEHGPWVETGSRFFVDGAWDGTFAHGYLHRATTVLGSGGQLVDDAVLFCTTTHTKERLQSIRIGNALLISNSFAYLLHAAGDSVDVNYPFYERDFMTSLKGVRRARKWVPTRSGRRVRLHYNEKIYVDRNLTIRTERYPDSAPFTTFEEYAEVVQRLLLRLNANARASERHIRYRPLSTLSTGYDSPAATVFAKGCGCTQAITFAEARTDYNDPQWNAPDANDSGAEIARHLGVNVKTFRRNGYDQRRDFPEAEFIATGNGGDDVIMCVAESELPGSMFYTGFLGDVLWDYNSREQKASRDYAYKDPSGASFNEFRLRLGFIHVPVPLLTFTRHPELHRISRSAEMKPWQIGGTYDRPVPRRLVETCGVPRHIYGQSKKAITQPIWLPTDFKNTMLPDSYADLLSYISKVESSANIRLRTRLRKHWARIVHTRCSPAAARLKRTCNWYGTRLARITGVRLLPVMNATEKQTNPNTLYATPAGLKFHWAMDKVLERYTPSVLQTKNTH